MVALATIDEFPYNDIRECHPTFIKLLIKDMANMPIFVRHPTCADVQLVYNVHPWSKKVYFVFLRIGVDIPEHVLRFIRYGLLPGESTTTIIHRDDLPPPHS